MLRQELIDAAEASGLATMPIEYVLKSSPALFVLFCFLIVHLTNFEFRVG